MNHIDDLILSLPDSLPESSAAVDRLVALGDAGLERPLAVMTGSVKLFAKSPHDFHVIDSALQGAFLAFARKDLTGTLRVIEREHALGVVSVLWGLGQVIDSRVTGVLTLGLKSKDPPARWAAVKGLERQSEPAATLALIGALRDRAVTVRNAAATALGERGDAQAIEPLTEALSSRAAVRSPEMQRVLQMALDRLKRRTP